MTTRRALLTLGLAPLLVLPAAARAQQPAPSYTVSGTVVSAADNQPLEHATVDLVNTKDNNKTPLSTTTDSLGRFSFAAVPKGSFNLRGEAEGFPSSTYEQHAQYSTAIITGSTVPTEGITLRLRPLGAISGTITDEFAEPVHNAQVHIFRRDNSNGENRIVPATQRNTNDLGQYYAPALEPGTYLIAVTASPWYAVHPRANVASSGFGIVPNQDPTLDMAYPVTYFPGASDATRAVPIEVHGNQVRADLQLTPVQAITITIPHVAGERNQPFAQLEASIFGTQQGGLPVMQTQTQDSMQITGLAPGDYVLRSNVQVPGDLPGGGMRFQPGPPSHIHLDRAATLSPDASSASEVHVALRSEDGGPLRNATIQLVPTDRRDFVGNNRRQNGSGIIFEAAPGDYYLNVAGISGFFIRKITTTGDKPLPSNDIHVKAGASLDLTVTLGRGTHTLHGVVERAHQPLSGAMLLLIPADEHLALRTVYRQQSDLDGSFELPGIPPGPYLLLALEEPGWTADWRSPDFLTRHLPHATPVLVPERGATDITLPAPIPSEPI